MNQLLPNRQDLKTAALIGVPVAVAGALLLRRWYRSRSLPPGPAGVPILGCLRMRDQSKLPATIHEVSRQYGGICSFRMGLQLVIAVTSYEMIKEMVEDQRFAGKPQIPLFVRLVQNCGMFFAEGESWSLQRRTSLRAMRDFGFAKEKSVEMVDNALDAVFHEMDSLCESQEPSEMQQILMAASNSIIAQLTFGQLFSRGDKEFAEYCEALGQLFSGTFFSPLVLYPQLDYVMRLLPMPQGVAQLLNTMQNFIRSQIQQRQRLMLDGDCQPECLCDAYIQEKLKAEKKGDFESFRDHQILRVCFDLFLAGTDTTARSVEWLLLFMAFNADIQRRVQAELDSVVGQSRRPRLGDKTQLHYVCAVIDEAYRKASLVGTGGIRRAVRDTHFHGHFIPSDAIILPSVYSVHHDEKLWSRPNHFHPEHFLDTSGRYKSSPHLIPFLIGKRACVGESLARMEVFLMFTCIMQRYSVTPSVASQRNKDEILEGHCTAFRVPSSYGLTVSKRL